MESQLPPNLPATLDELVTTWLDWAQAADLLGVSTSRIGHLLDMHQLVGAVPAKRSGVHVPAELLLPGKIVKGVPGVITLLHDGGYSDHEIIRFLYTPDASLPGRPIDALRENRGSEVKRRAQAMAF